MTCSSNQACRSILGSNGRNELRIVAFSRLYTVILTDIQWAILRRKSIPSINLFILDTVYEKEHRIKYATNIIWTTSKCTKSYMITILLSDLKSLTTQQNQNIHHHHKLFKYNLVRFQTSIYGFREKYSEIRNGRWIFRSVSCFSVKLLLLFPIIGY